MMNIHADKIIANKFVGDFENNNDGFNIGDIKWSTTDLTQVGFLLCNGASIRRDTYIDLFNAIGTRWGSVDEEHFNLPNLINRFIEGSENAGGYKEAGLPNITGAQGETNNYYPYGHANGAFVSQGNTSNLGNQLETYVSQYSGFAALSFDASRSNSIYGKSNTVQPNSALLTPYIKAFNGASASSADIEITKVANDLADKSNRDLSNLSDKGKKAFFPSGTFVGIPITGSGTRFTAPANGYVAFNCSSNALDAVVDVASLTKGYVVRGCGANGDMGNYLNVVVFMPVTKEDIIEIRYQQIKQFLYSYFYYAENEI